MKPKLIILLELWGEEKSDCVSDYVELLKDKFEIHYYDCCELGAIDHKQFLNGGIETAVNNLLKKERNKINILTFSIGGTIASKATLKGLKVETCHFIHTIRYETQVPNCKIKLYFGEKDNYKPDASWF